MHVRACVHAYARARARLYVCVCVYVCVMHTLSKESKSKLIFNL